MKIALLTFINTNNYGATLQGYAMDRFLKQQGHEVVILNVPLLNAGKDKKKSLVTRAFNKISRYVRRLFILVNKSKRQEFYEKRRIIRDENILVESQKFDSINMSYFDLFRKEYLPNITEKKYFFDNDFTDSFLSDIDVFIVGSDQVWNPWITNTQVGVFFFSFVNGAQKRIAYAPSFGGSRKWNYTESETQYIKTLLAKFDGISVRDGDSKYILNNIFKFDGFEVLDPTFLIDNYDELIADCDLDAKGSVFSFKFIINEYWADVVKFLAAELNLDVRMDACLIPFEGLPFKPLCKPNEWIKLIKTSDFVFTDSFHGMVFCILFKKEFIVTPSYENGEGRYKDLAMKLGLEDRLYTTTKDIYNNKEVWKQKIDYDAVYEKLDKLKMNSKDYLLSHLK